MGKSTKVLFQGLSLSNSSQLDHIGQDETVKLLVTLYANTHLSLYLPIPSFDFGSSYCCYVQTHLKMWRHDNNPFFSFVPAVWGQLILIHDV